MQEIEEMARELVKTYPFLSDDKSQLFVPEREETGKFPRCPKTGKTYAGSIVLADTGVKYVNCRVELLKI